jgi:hypothetical protein
VTTAAEKAMQSPLLEDEEDSKDHHREPHEVIPPEFLAKVEKGEHGENGKGDDLLYRLQLSGGEFIVADPVGGHLKAVLDESDQPAYEDNLPQRTALEFQMTVPRKGHEHVGHDQKDNRSHRCTLLLEHKSQGILQKTRVIVWPAMLKAICKERLWCFLQQLFFAVEACIATMQKYNGLFEHL